jgi:hypothetical protein
MFYMKVVALVNCYALGPTTNISYWFLYTDHVRHDSAWISSFSKFSIFHKFVFMSGFTAFAFVFVFKCRSENGWGVLCPFSYKLCQIWAWAPYRMPYISVQILEVILQFNRGSTHSMLDPLGWSLGVIQCKMIMII